MSPSFLTRVAPDASGVARRFPVAVVAFAALAATLVRYDDASMRNWPGGWVAGLSATAFSAVALALWSEARTGRPVPAIQLLALVAGAAAGGLHATLWMSIVWLHVALFGAILLAPAPGKSEGEFWRSTCGSARWRLSRGSPPAFSCSD